MVKQTSEPTQYLLSNIAPKIEDLVTEVQSGFRGQYNNNNNNKANPIQYNNEFKRAQPRR